MTWFEPDSISLMDKEKFISVWKISVQKSVRCIQVFKVIDKVIDLQFFEPLPFLPQASESWIPSMHYHTRTNLCCVQGPKVASLQNVLEWLFQSNF